MMRAWTGGMVLILTCGVLPYRSVPKPRVIRKGANKSAASGPPSSRV